MLDVLSVLHRLGGLDGNLFRRRDRLFGEVNARPCRCGDEEDSPQYQRNSFVILHDFIPFA
jgi:hypothetical protein